MTTTYDMSRTASAWPATALCWWHVGLARIICARSLSMIDVLCGAWSRAG